MSSGDLSVASRPTPEGHQTGRLTNSPNDDRQLAELLTETSGILGSSLACGWPASLAASAPNPLYFLRGRAYSRGMADHSAIEWTEATWNPTSGCTKVSPGCDRCYAERMALRFPKTFPNGFDLSLRPGALELPLHWRRPRTIFVNSMSDLFHAEVPDSYIAQVFDVMARTPQHTYQVLTKRAERLARLAPRLPWPSNVWMGVSVEVPKYHWRIDYLRKTSASVRFISAEPLLAALPDLNLDGIHWLIAGGESQPGAREANSDWFEDLRDQCVRAGVAFFLKQLGGHPSKRGGDKALLDGRRWIELPVKVQPALASA